MTGSVRQDRESAGPIVLACDSGYAMQLATTLRSLVEHDQGRRTAEICVLSDGFTESLKRRVRTSLPPGSVSIRWIQVDLEKFRSFATLDGISKMTFARLLMAEALPSTAKRVLYLDADLLVLDDLATLWTTDLEGAILGAVVDGVDAQLKAGALEHAGLPRVLKYFNAGVLLIDLDRWRSERVSERALEYLAANPTSLFADQDALNVACDGNWKQLDARWNFQKHYNVRLSELPSDRRPGIVHFVTNLKPWKPSSFSDNAGFYDMFRSRTQFARTRWNLLHDFASGIWYRTKRLLRRSALLRYAWHHILSWTSAQRRPRRIVA